MSRIYQQNIKKPSPDLDIVRNDKITNDDLTEVIPANRVASKIKLFTRVASKIKLFTNSSTTNNAKTASPLSSRNFASSSAPKSKPGNQN